jgi:hypothetical protein
VVCFAGGGWRVAAGEHAAGIAQGECGPDRWGDESGLSAHVQHFAVAAEYDGQDVGVATHPPQLAGRDRLTVADQTGSGRVPQQLVVVEGDDDTGSVPSGGGGPSTGLVVTDHARQSIGPPLGRADSHGQRIPFLQKGAAL